MVRKLLSLLLALTLCFGYMIPAGMAEGGTDGGALGGVEAPVVLEPEEPEAPEAEPEEPGTPEPEAGPGEPEAPGSVGPESGAGAPEEPGTPDPEVPAPEPEEPETEPIPEPTPEELFLAAVALLPQDPEAVETVTEELEEQLRVVTEQLYALLTEDQLAAIAALTPEEQAGLAPLHAAALLVLRLNAQITELNAQAVQSVRDLIAALPAAEAMTVDHEAQISAAVAAYDALTATQKALLTEEETAALAAAQALMAELLAKAQAALVDGMIALLPEASEITAENYEEYQAPAQEASDALLALDDYERAFVRGAQTLEDFLRELQAKKNAAQVLAMLNPFLSSIAAPADTLTFRDSPTSVDRALAVEAAYGELTDAERADPILASSWIAFGPFLTLARDLDYIREHGKIIITRPSLTLVTGEDADIPGYDWLGLGGTDLASEYPLVLEFPGTSHITRVGNKIHAVAETVEDEKILVYGGNAQALKELAEAITVTVLPPPPDLDHIGAEDIDSKAVIYEDVYTFSRAYVVVDGYYEQDVPVKIAIGKRIYELNSLTDSGYGVAVSFANGKLPACLSVTQRRFTYLRFDPERLGGDKYTTYKTKLKYDITFPGPGGETVTLLTNEIKIVVTDKPTQLAFKPQVINTFYESKEGEYYEGDSRYPAVWMTPAKKGIEPYMLLTILDPDKAKYPVTVEYDAGRGQYKLVIHDGVRVTKNVTWKVRFMASHPALKADRSYIVTVPITLKRTAPPLSLSPKTVKPKNINDGFQVDVCAKKGYPMSALSIDAVRLPENSERSPYQELFKEPELISFNDSRWRYGISLKAAATGALPSTFKLLLRVEFRGTGNVVDLPLTVTAPSGKISLSPTSCALNWTETGLGSIACCAVRFLTGDNSTPSLNFAASTVNGIPFGAPGCPLLISMEAGFQRAFILKNPDTLPGKTYKVVFAFGSGQAVKLNVSTKPTQNKIKLGKTAFAADRQSPEDALLTPCGQTYYFLAGLPAPLVLERKVGNAWTPAPSALVMDFPEEMILRIRGMSTLEAGKHTFRVFAPDQGIPAAKGTTFTVTVKEAALKFTATMTSPNADVLEPDDDILIFTNLKLTGLLDDGCLKNLNGSPPKWTVTVGGAGGRYMELGLADSGSVRLVWKDVGTYGLRQNGLKSFKLTLQLRERATGKLLAETKAFTVKPVQKPVAVELLYMRALYGDPNVKWVTLYPAMIYTWDYFGISMRTYFVGDNFREERVQWVAVKNAEKSNYKVYLRGSSEWGGLEELAGIAIGYKNAAAARKVKAGETVTLLVMLESGVKPIEVKVPVKNFR